MRLPFPLFARFLGAAFLLASITVEADSVPKLINYQGKLLQGDSSPLPNGTYVLRFELFDAATGGNLVWGETQQAAVVSGVFNVILGGGQTLDPAPPVTDLRFAFGDANRFLQTTIVSGPSGTINQTLAPRQQLTSVPYAVQAFNGVPPGTVVPYFGTTAPPGWELCLGQTVEREGKYARLFEAIGTACGAPNQNSFNLPDLRGRFLRGADGEDGTDADRDPDSSSRLAMAAAGNVGNAVGSIQNHSTALPSEPFTTDTKGEHQHHVPLWRTDGAANKNLFGQASDQQTGTSACPPPAGDHFHTITDGGDSETRPVNAACNFIIKY